MAQAFNLTAQLNLRGPANIRQIAAQIRRDLGNINATVKFSIDPTTTRNVAGLTSALKSLNSTLSATTKSASDATSAMRSFGNAVNSINIKNIPQQISASAKAVASLDRASGSSTKALANASSEMVEFGKQAGLAVRRFAAFSAVTSVIYGITNSINQGVQAFIDYDRQLTRIQQVTGESAEGLTKLQNQISNLSTSLGVSSKELTNVALTLAQAGLSARDTERALKALALSSLAPSFDDMNETVEGSIALMRQFDISAKDLEQSLGAVNAVSAKFAVEASDIITAIQRTGSVFATASKGVSEGKDALNEFIAVFTSVRATTRESAETIATGLRTIFTRIQRGSTINALKEFGVNLTDAQGKFVGAYKAVELLSQGLSKIDPRSLDFSRIIEELGGFRQIGKVIPLIQQFAVAQDALSVAQRGQGSLARDSVTAQRSLANQISKVREEFLALFREIGSSKSFQTIVRGALDLTSALIKVTSSLKGLMPALSILLAFKGVKALTQFTAGLSGGLRRGPDNKEGSGSAPLFNRGGTVRKFARGGLVPGQGDGDTVPAMLEPGEFVIRKKAVETIGADNLHSMNKYGGGGSIRSGSSNRRKRFAAGGQAKVASVNKNLGAYDGDTLNINVTPTDDPFNTRTRLMDVDSFEVRGGKAWQKELGNRAKKVAQNFYQDKSNDYILNSISGDQGNEKFGRYLIKDSSLSGTIKSLGLGTPYGTKASSLTKETYAKQFGKTVEQTLKDTAQYKNLGGLIQKFAKGGSPKKTEGLLMSALKGYKDDLFGSSLPDILKTQGLSSTLDKIEKTYGVSSAKVIGSGGENVAFDIGQEILKISRTGFGAQQLLRDFGVNKKNIQKIGNYQLPSNVPGVTGYRKIKTFGKLTAALQDKISVTDDEKSLRDYQLLQGKLAKAGQYWLDAGPSNMGYDKKGNPTVIDGLVFSKAFVNKNIGEDSREDIEVEGMMAEDVYDRWSKKQKGRQRFAVGGKVLRNLGYIDYDVIANEANKDIVEAGMKSAGVTGPRVYADYLTQLAVKARKDNNIQKLRAIYGVAGSGKTTLARGQGTDKGTLRETNRFPILSPEDIEKANEILILTSTVSRSKMEDFLSEVDRAYTLSSTTASERDRIKAQRASRDITGVGLEGRQPGTTTGVGTDTAVGEALLGEALGARSTVLGRTASGKLRRKRGQELVDIVKKKIAFTWGGFAPTTAGHESIMDAAAAMGFSPDDFIALVGANEGIKAGDPSSYRTAVFDQDFRVLLAKAGFGARGATVLPKPRDFEVPQGFDVTEEGNERRRVLLPKKGSRAFVADKTADQMTKYKEAGYSVTNLERTGGISGTMVRDLIMAGDMAKLQEVLSPGVYEIISNNIGRLRNRANALPAIIEQVKANQGLSIENLDKDIAAIGIKRIDAKKVASDPEYAAKAQLLEQLREKKKKIQSAAAFEPYRLLSELAQAQPDKYALDFGAPKLSSMAGVQKLPTMPLSKNLGGLIRRYEDAGAVSATSGKPIGRAEILRVLDLDKAAAAAGIDRTQVYDLLGIKNPNDKQKQLREAIEQEYLKKVNRLAGAQQGLSTRLQNRGLEFAAAGLFGKPFEPQTLQIKSPRLKKPRTVSVISGVMKAEAAGKLESIFLGGSQELAQKAADAIRGEYGESGPATGQAILNANAEASIQGGLLEKAIQILGGPGKVKGQGFDFPEGLKGAAKYFGLPEDIPTDVKRTLEGPSTFQDNIVTYLKNVMGYKLGGKVYDLQQGTGLSDFEFNQLVKFGNTNDFNDQDFKDYLAQYMRNKAAKKNLVVNSEQLRQVLLSGTRTPQATPAQLSLAEQLKGEPDPQYRSRYAAGGFVKNALAKSQKTITWGKGPNAPTTTSIDPRATELFQKQATIDTIEQELSQLGINGLKFIGSGKDSLAYDAGARIVKFSPGGLKKYSSNISEQLRPSFAKLIEGYGVEVMPKVDTNVTDEDLANLQKTITSKGYEWGDAAKDNMGKLGNQLVAIDGDITPLRMPAPPLPKQMADGGPVKLYHGTLTGEGDATLKSIKEKGILSSLARGYGQGSGFYVWTSRDSALKHTQAIESGSIPTNAAKGGYRMIVELTEMLDPKNWDLDYEIQAGDVANFVFENFEKAQALLEKAKGINLGGGLSDFTLRSKNAEFTNPYAGKKVRQISLGFKEDGREKRTSVDTLGMDYTLRTGQVIGGLVAALKAVDPTVMDAFEQQFFSNLKPGQALKYVGSAPLTPSNIEVFSTQPSDDKSWTNDPSADIRLKKGKDTRNYGQIGLTEDTGMISVGYYKNDERSGYLNAYKMRDYLYYVGDVRTTGGYGPRLYDAAMEAATEKGAMLTSDRASVSEDAKGVWSTYFNSRPDVRKTPLKPDDWTKSSLIDPKLYGKEETWPPPTDPAWILQSGYSKTPELIRDPEAIKINKKALGGLIHRFADGGSPQDTVPALLTPGEFVINKQAAQKIGYNKLAKLNNADKVQGYNAGGIVGGIAHFAAGGGVGIPMFDWLSKLGKSYDRRPDNVSRATVGVDDETISGVKELVKSLNELGISASNTAEILNAGGRITYKEIEKAMKLDVERLRIAGASIDSVIAAEKKLAEVRSKRDTDVKQRQTLEGAFGGVSGRSSGQVQQQILKETDSRAAQKIQTIENSRLSQARNELIVQKKTKDYDQIEQDLIRANPLGNMADIQREASRRVMARSAAGRYDLTQSELTSLKTSSAVSQDENRNIREAEALKATSRITGQSRSDLAKAGIGGGDIIKYAQESMRDRKTLAEMDKQLLEMKLEEKRNSAEYIAASASEQRAMLDEARKAANEEISIRREMINKMAEQNGEMGVGSAGMFDFRNSPVLNAVKERYIAKKGDPSLMGLKDTALSDVGLAAGVIGGQGKNIANLMYNTETESGQKQAAATGAGIEQAGTTLSAGLMAASQALTIPVVGPWIAGLTAVGTVAFAAADYLYDFTGSQKAAVLELEKSLNATKLEDATDKLDKAFSDFESDMSNLDLQAALGTAFAERNAAAQGSAITNLKDAQFKVGQSRTWLEWAAGASKPEMEQKDYRELARSQAQANSIAAGQAKSYFRSQINTGMSLQDITQNETGRAAIESYGLGNADIQDETNKELVRRFGDLSKVTEDQRKSVLMGIATRAFLNDKEMIAAVKAAELAKAMEDADRAGRKLAQSFSRLFSSIDQSINRIKFESDQRKKLADARAAGLNGRAELVSGVSEADRTVNILENRNAYTPEEYQKAVAETTAMVPGEAGTRLQEATMLDATLGDKLNASIAAAVKNSASTDVSAAAKTAKDTGFAQINSLNVSEEIKKTLRDKLEADINSAETEANKDASGKPERALEIFTEKVGNAANGAGQFVKGAQEATRKLAELKAAEFAKFVEGINESAKALKEASNLFKKSRDIMAQGQRTANEVLTGQTESYSDVKGRMMGDVAGLTGGLTDPTAIRQKVVDMSGQLADKNKKATDAKAASLADPGNAKLADDAKKAAIEARDFTVELNNAKEGLDMLAESTELVNKALDDLKAATQMQAQRENFVNQLLTNTPEEADKLNQTFIRLQRNLSGGLNNAGNQRDARKAYNDTLRQTGNVREATRAGNTVLANQRKETLGLMKDPGFRATIGLQMGMQNPNVSEAQIEQKLNDMELQLMKQMAVESGMMNNPLVRQAIAAKEDKKADPMVKARAERYLEAVGLQSKATKEQAELKAIESTEALTASNAQLIQALNDLKSVIEAATGRDAAIEGGKKDAAGQPIVPINVGGAPLGAAPKAKGGVIYASAGRLINFQPQGTDTVPAMLSPGEFVINAQATAQHLPLLQAINDGQANIVSKGLSRGGVVYLAKGSVKPVKPTDVASATAELSEISTRQADRANYTATNGLSEFVNPERVADEAEHSRLVEQERQASMATQFAARFIGRTDGNYKPMDEIVREEAARDAQNRMGNTWDRMTDEQKAAATQEAMPRIQSVADSYKSQQDAALVSGMNIEDFRSQAYRTSSSNFSNALDARIYHERDMRDKSEGRATRSENARQNELTDFITSNYGLTHRTPVSPDITSNPLVADAARTKADELLTPPSNRAVAQQARIDRAVAQQARMDANAASAEAAQQNAGPDINDSRYHTRDPLEGAVRFVRDGGSRAQLPALETAMKKAWARAESIPQAPSGGDQWLSDVMAAGEAGTQGQPTAGRITYPTQIPPGWYSEAFRTKEDMHEFYTQRTLMNRTSSQLNYNPSRYNEDQFGMAMTTTISDSQPAPISPMLSISAPTTSPQPALPLSNQVMPGLNLPPALPQSAPTQSGRMTYQDMMKARRDAYKARKDQAKAYNEAFKADRAARVARVAPKRTLTESQQALANLPPQERSQRNKERLLFGSPIADGDPDAATKRSRAANLSPEQIRELADLKRGEELAKRVGWTITEDTIDGGAGQYGRYAGYEKGEVPGEVSGMSLENEQLLRRYQESRFMELGKARDKARADKFAEDRKKEGEAYQAKLAQGSQEVAERFRLQAVAREEAYKKKETEERIAQYSQQNRYDLAENDAVGSYMKSIINAGRLPTPEEEATIGRLREERIRANGEAERERQAGLQDQKDNKRTAELRVAEQNRLMSVADRVYSLSLGSSDARSSTDRLTALRTQSNSISERIIGLQKSMVQMRMEKQAALGVEDASSVSQLQGDLEKYNPEYSAQKVQLDALLADQEAYNLAIQSAESGISPQDLVKKQIESPQFATQIDQKLVAEKDKSIIDRARLDASVTDTPQWTSGVSTTVADKDKELRNWTWPPPSNLVFPSSWSDAKRQQYVLAKQAGKPFLAEQQAAEQARQQATIPEKPKSDAWVDSNNWGISALGYLGGLGQSAGRGVLGAAATVAGGVTAGVGGVMQVADSMFTSEEELRTQRIEAASRAIQERMIAQGRATREEIEEARRAEASSAGPRTGGEAVTQLGGRMALAGIRDVGNVGNAIVGGVFDPTGYRSSQGYVSQEMSKNSEQLRQAGWGGAALATDVVNTFAYLSAEGAAIAAGGGGNLGSGGAFGTAVNAIVKPLTLADRAGGMIIGNSVGVLSRMPGVGGLIDEIGGGVDVARNMFTSRGRRLAEATENSATSFRQWSNNMRAAMAAENAEDAARSIRETMDSARYASPETYMDYKLSSLPQTTTRTSRARQIRELRARGDNATAQRLSRDALGNRYRLGDDAFGEFGTTTDDIARLRQRELFNSGFSERSANPVYNPAQRRPILERANNNARSRRELSGLPEVPRTQSQVIDDIVRQEQDIYGPAYRLARQSEAPLSPYGTLADQLKERATTIANRRAAAVRYADRPSSVFDPNVDLTLGPAVSTPAGIPVSSATASSRTRGPFSISPSSSTTSTVASSADDILPSARMGLSPAKREAAAAAAQADAIASGRQTVPSVPTRQPTSYPRLLEQPQQVSSSELRDRGMSILGANDSAVYTQNGRLYLGEPGKGGVRLYETETGQLSVYGTSPAIYNKNPTSAAPSTPVPLTPRQQIVANAGSSNPQTANQIRGNVSSSTKPKPSFDSPDYVEYYSARFANSPFHMEARRLLARQQVVHSRINAATNAREQQQKANEAWKAFLKRMKAEGFSSGGLVYLSEGGWVSKSPVLPSTAGTAGASVALAGLRGNIGYGIGMGVDNALGLNGTGAMIGSAADIGVGTGMETAKAANTLRAAGTALTSSGGASSLASAAGTGLAAGYGAYAVADLAGEAAALATGQTKLEDYDKENRRQANQNYATNVGENFARPGRAAIQFGVESKGLVSDIAEARAASRRYDEKAARIQESRDFAQAMMANGTLSLASPSNTSQPFLTLDNKRVPQNRASGGIIYANNGALASIAQGTDTVPAMLTPGEFVVNREAAQTYMPILHAINSGHFNRGGIVNYLANGGVVAPKYYAGGGELPIQRSSSGGGVSNTVGNDIGAAISQALGSAVGQLSEFASNLTTGLQQSMEQYGQISQTINQSVTTFSESANKIESSAQTYDQAASSIPSTIQTTVTGNVMTNHTGLDRLTGNIEKDIYSNTAKQSSTISQNSIAHVDKTAYEGGLNSSANAKPMGMR